MVRLYNGYDYNSLDTSDTLRQANEAFICPALFHLNIYEAKFILFISFTALKRTLMWVFRAEKLLTLAPHH